MGPRNVTAALVLALVLATSRARATPDQIGPLAITSWDAGTVTLAGASIHVVVDYPSGGGGPFPVVGVVHGASRNGTYQRVLAQTLASYGLVAVVPDMPCTVFSCDHNANATQLLAMLDWAVMQSASATSPIAGRIDGTRRGFTGHSWGALAVHLAAARDSTLRSVVLLDPNDDANVGLTAAPMVHAPEMQLLAAIRGPCNNQWIASSVTPRLTGPVLQLTLPTSAHCDPEDPTDALCASFCGSGNRATTPYFRRYAVAWTLCNLIGDPSVATWIGGDGFAADVSAGHLSGAVESMLASLACGPRGATDGGTIVDAGVTDAATMDAPADDARADTNQRADAGMDVVIDTGGDAPDAGMAPAAGSCRCAATGASTDPRRRASLVVAIVAGAALIVRRRRGGRRVARMA